MTRAAACLALTLAALPRGAVADDGRAPTPRPLGAVEAASTLLLTGGTPRNRAGAALTVYLGRRLGVRVGVQQVTVAPLAEAGVATLGLAYRVAAARPRLELVARAEAGAAWPAAPALGGGATTYLWPSGWPLAVTLDLGAHAIIDGVRDSRVAISVGAGLALAR